MRRLGLMPIEMLPVSVRRLVSRCCFTGATSDHPRVLVNYTYMRDGLVAFIETPKAA